MQQEPIDAGQVTGSAAEVYEEQFVPALFAPWAPRVADAAGVRPGDAVVDVACGTGVLAREAARRAGAGSRIVGVDLNDGMLAVAARARAPIEWLRAPAEALPLPDALFDAAVCQFGLMFFQDRVAALREMQRVLRPGGTMAVAVWASLDRNPGYARLIQLLQRLFGEEAASALQSPYALGDVEELAALWRQAGIDGARIDTSSAPARFSSLRGWLHTEVRGWTLEQHVDDAGFERLLRAAETELGSFVDPEGRVEFAASAHVVTSTKR